MQANPPRFRSRVANCAIWSAPLSVRAAVGTTLVAAAMALVSDAVDAQTVVGQVIDESGAPIAAAIVTATNAQGAAMHIVSSTTGQFAFRLASAGAYDIHVARVGFASVTTTRITVGASDTVRVAASAPLTPMALASASTKGANSCRVRPDTALVTAKVWTEIRKALMTTQIPRYQSSLVGQWQEFERTLDSTGKKVTGQRVVQATHNTPTLFKSIPAATMSTHGFVVTDASGTAYYAPDVALLLTAEFEASHCLKLASSGKGKVDEIGVEFAPTRKTRGVYDISGTMWVERTTGTLRRIEFLYTGLPDLPVEVAGGGYLEFAGLLTGEFALTAWVARLPLFDVYKRNMNARDNDTRYARSDTLVRAVQEVGGILKQIRDGSAIIYEGKASPLGSQPPAPMEFTALTIPLSSRDICQVSSDTSNAKILTARGYWPSSPCLRASDYGSATRTALAVR